MNDFCIEVLTPDAALRAQDGVLRAAALAVTADARALAQRIVQAAQAEAAALREQARNDAEQAVSAKEQETLQRGRQLLQKLQDTHAGFLERAEDIVLDLAQGLFDRLVAEQTPRARVEAMLRHLLREAPPRLVNPLLRVHPDDQGLLPEVEWEVKADVGLAPGRCRLEANNGEWCVDFEAAVVALRVALAGVERDGVAGLGGD